MDGTPDVPLIALTRSSNKPLGGQSPSVLAGRWCLSDAEAFADGVSLDPRVLGYHWADEGKRAADYGYLSDLYERLLLGLTDVLNAVHVLDRDVRYWETVLGPWTLTYVSVLFDRWEIARTLLATFEKVQLEELCHREQEVPGNYTEFVLRSADDDAFNQFLLERAIRAQATPAQVSWKSDPSDSRQVSALDALAASTDSPTTSATSRLARRNLRARIVRLQRRVFRSKVLRLLQPRVFFVASYFPKSFLFLLQARMAQIPYPDWSPFPIAPRRNPAPNSELRTMLRAEILLRSKEFANPFEHHLWQSVADFIPLSAVESLDFYRKFALGFLTRTRVAVTSNAHWHDEGFKVWAAESTQRGMRLVISEHGGGFPVKEYCFNWEERISDHNIPTFGKTHENHLRLPLPKYVVARNPTNPGRGAAHPASRRGGLLVIPNHGNRYTIRAASQIKSFQSVDSFRLTVTALNLLSDRVGNQVTVKTMDLPRPAGDMSLGSQYLAATTRPVTVSTAKLARALGEARLILCTYPESNFAEAMMSGVPVILLYDEGVSVSHSVAEPTITLLKRARIIFNDPVAAALHIDSVWDQPDEWWNSEEVTRARDSFIAPTLVVSRDPMEAWTGMLREEMKLPMSADET